MKSTFVLCQATQEGNALLNLKRAAAHAKEATETYHADVLVFPEVYQSHYPLSTDSSIVQAAAEPLNGPFVSGMQKIARENKLWMIFGMRELTGKDSHYNTIVTLNEQGNIVGTYRKRHLYDAFSYRESAYVTAGREESLPIQTPFGTLGIFVCYELRYPEVARALTRAGADILIMPTAWVKGPGKSMQFEVLCRARAIENASYLLACDLCGPDTLGESIAVSPTGEIVGRAGTDEVLLPVTVDAEEIAKTRTICPSYRG